MDVLGRFGPLAGRILIALVFVVGGIEKLTGFQGTVAYIAGKGMPLPQVAAVAAMVVELGGSAMLVLGWKARWAAAALFLFSGLAAAMFHNFWALPPDQAANQMVHFLKNISMMGGLLYVMTYGSGPLSADGKASGRS